ncbi:DoxX family protein [Vibrio maritimus]|uniref:DoxX family protein n=1 Tax=Vibrio maritimus TaxID=990268 RepID=UPI001F3222DB|nr:DoxX family protein [Vibrio maritimus]
MFIAQILLIGFFLFASSIKIFGWVKPIFEPQLTFFHKYGLNRTAMFLVGIIELGGALGILYGLFTVNALTSAVSSGLIAFTSIGAMWFHFRFDTWKDAVPSMITLFVSLWVSVPLLDLLFNSI